MHHEIRLRPAYTIPHILGTRQNTQVSFAPWPLYPREK